VFVAAVRDGKTLREISGTTGLSVFKLTQMISRVDQELDPHRSARNVDHRITLDSPIEDLSLSTRARNALHQVGCVTVRNILDRDFSRAVRSFGAGTRHEVAMVLIHHGFAPPPELEYQQSSIEALARDLDRLRQTIEQRYRSSLDHLARLEDTVRKLANGSGTNHADDEQACCLPRLTGDAGLEKTDGE
jgi:hypothetical protein